jgi:formylglycine-generating enzyme required for sulfatase activity
MMWDSSPQPGPPGNRLAGESSPYLLQHAHNPVDWFPWGDEAPDASRVNACDRRCQALEGLPGYLEGGGLAAGDDGHGGTAPARSFEAGASREGVLHLAGNVAELVDAWHDDARTFRFTLGGSWSSLEAEEVQPTARTRFAPATRSSDVGFRCAVDRETP